MIKTEALKNIENLFNDWQTDALAFYAYLNDKYIRQRRAVPDSEFNVAKWKDFGDILFEDTSSERVRFNSKYRPSLVRIEAEDNLLLFSQPGNEFVYFKRINTLVRELEIAWQTDRREGKKYVVTEGTDKLIDELPQTVDHQSRKILQLALVRFIESITGFDKVAANSLIVHQYPDEFEQILPYNRRHELPDSLDTQPGDPDLLPGRALTAFQQVLFTRLLQRAGLFPKRLENTDEAPELKAIALLTGLSYQNDLKGAKGANVKVNQLLSPNLRPDMSPGQIVHKLTDLDAVAEAARLLNLDVILIEIETIREDLIKIGKF